MGIIENYVDAHTEEEQASFMDFLEAESKRYQRISSFINLITNLLIIIIIIVIGASL